MQPSTILFDLDGTLTDPQLGITRCIQYALVELGHQPPDAEELHWCIGPPIQESFSQLLNTSNNDVINEAIALYRRRFSTIGLWENSLYPQIIETLQPFAMLVIKPLWQLQNHIFMPYPLLNILAYRCFLMVFMVVKLMELAV